MKPCEKFAISLARNRVELLRSNKNSKWEVLGYFDPNSPNVFEKLEKLRGQAAALQDSTPVVDVLLPQELVFSQTLIVDSDKSTKHAAEALAKRSNIPLDELCVVTAPLTSKRTQPVAAITRSAIQEANDFLSSAGFATNNFRASSRVAGFSAPPVFHKEINKSLRSENRLSQPKYILMALGFILILFSSFSIVENEKPLDIQKNDETNQLVSNNPFGNQSKSKSIKNTFINSNSEIASDKETRVFRVNTKKITTRQFLSGSSDSLSKKSASNLLFKVNPIPSSELFKPYSYEKINTLTLRKGLNTTDTTNSFKFIKKLDPPSKLENIGIGITIATLKKIMLDIENLSPLLNQATKKNAQSKLKSKQQLPPQTYYTANIKPNVPKLYSIIENSDVESKLEVTPELTQKARAYANAILPPKRKELINLIRILREPTISSGALTFSMIPMPRPLEVVKNAKRINPKTIAIKARATRGPGIPPKASVGYNATRKNLIDLDRTNVIGIFGKKSNPFALVRLSSGEIIKVKIGDRFKGWRVLAIDDNKIHIENGVKQETIRLPG